MSQPKSKQNDFSNFFFLLEMYSRSNFWATIDKCVYSSCFVESPSMLSRCSLLSFVLPTNVTRLHHINYISATRDANPNVPERHDDPRSNYVSFHSFFSFAFLRNLHVIEELVASLKLFVRQSFRNICGCI